MPKPSIRTLAVAAATVAALLASGCMASSPPSPAPQPSPRPQAPLAEAWRWEVPTPAYVGMPAAEGDEVAFSYGHRALVLLGPGGALRWSTEVAGVRDVAPTLAPTMVVAATDDGVAAFDRRSGRRLWQAVLDERANTPVVIGEVVAATTWEGSLVGLGSTDGAVRWRVGLSGAALGPATTGFTEAGDPVVVATSDAGSSGTITAFHAGNGGAVWAHTIEPGGVSAPAVFPAPPGMSVVAVDGGLAARALDLATGTERWAVALQGAGSPEVPPLAADGGHVVVAHRLGGLVMVSADGEVRWRAGSDGAAVRGGPAGPGPGGGYALPLDDGRILLVGVGPPHAATAEAPTSVLDVPGRASGVARGPDGELLVTTREAPVNAVVAYSGW